MGKTLKNPKWRALSNAILTSAIGVLLAILGDWDPNQNYFVFKIITFVVLSIFDIWLIVFCAVQDLTKTGDGSLS